MLVFILSLSLVIGSLSLTSLSLSRPLSPGSTGGEQHFCESYRSESSEADYGSL